MVRMMRNDEKYEDDYLVKIPIAMKLTRPEILETTATHEDDKDDDSDNEDDAKLLII